MSKKQTSTDPMPLPVAAMVVMGLLGGLIVGASFVLIQYWPLPASVTPALDFRMGFLWGAVVGGSFGAILGFLTDEKHFEANS